MTYIQELGQRAKEVSKTIGNACTKRKNEALEAIAEKLWENRSYILEENARDIENAQKNGMNAGLIDRLTLTENGISGICEAVRKLIALDDPVGITESGTVRPNGLRIYKTRVALGVVGIIFESRPNVTVDGAILCLKSGNAVILRGGKEAIFSNKALAYVMRQAVMLAGLPEDIIQLVEDSSRETANEMMKLNEYLDVLIPRGGAGLIHAVVENATVPVIETGVGNCHIYVEKSADLQMAANIVENAKTSRVSVCNSEESLLVDESIAKEFLPLIKSRLDQYHVKWYGCDKTRAIIPVS
ncbi:MAG: glutamate-5-semialdehyde dehydrogenase, partial [Oscillospiraceae bacterium]